MKKLFCVLLAALLLCTLAACGHEDTAQKPAAEAAEDTAALDIDLTVLSSTMVYSEVYSMMSFPDDYIGNTVKMKGQFAIGYVYNTDGTPDEYPELGAEITVVGTFEWYEEDGFRYYRLGNASFVN